MGIAAPTHAGKLRPLAEFPLDVQDLVVDLVAVFVFEDKGIVGLGTEGIVEFRWPIVGEVNRRYNGAAPGVGQRIAEGSHEFMVVFRQVFGSRCQVPECPDFQLGCQLADLVEPIHHIPVDLVD